MNHNGRQAKRDTTRQQVEDATLAQFNAVSNALPTAFADALAFEGLALPAGKVDAVAFGVWLRLAAAHQECAELQGVAGVFDDDGDGVEYPKEIVTLCERLT